ncbi:transposase [Roseobacter sp. OBYS 0001]|uniref:transposase n=1 Tax=Roseobacter sp. OBYS 0001 TaxID=882651 RepID=UPI0035B61C3D
MISEKLLVKRSNYGNVQMAKILSEAESGVSVADLYREHNISCKRFHKCRFKYSRIGASPITPAKALNEEGKRLKKIYLEEPATLFSQGSALKKAVRPSIINRTRNQSVSHHSS